MDAAFSTVGEILDALGGVATVARDAGLRPNSVLYWRQRGRIPPDHWDMLIDLAIRQRVPIDRDILRRASRPRRRRVALAATPEAEAAA